MSKDRAVKGVIWSAIERFSVQIVQFVVTIILARLLSPTDFGIVAIILVVMNILQIFNEVGFGAALMQKLDRDELDFSTVFVFNLIFGVILYMVLYLIAPHFASFFKLPDLAKLTRLLGLNLIISSFIVVQRTKLFIKVDFKTQAKAALIAIILSGCVGIYCAYNGMGVMALLVQQLLNNIINTLFIWLFVKWKPKLKFSYQRFMILYNFAYKLILARLVNTIFQEAYSLVIGKMYAPAQLGYFNRAKSFVSISSNNITTIVQKVSIPILCEAQKNKEKMGSQLLEFIQKTAFIVYPLLFGLYVLAEPLIRVLLTDKWLPSVWMLQVLCPVGLLFVISTFNLNVFNATGRTDWALKSEIIKKILNVLILIGAVLVSFEALIYSQIVIALLDFLIDTYYTKKQIYLNRARQLKSVSGILVVSLIMSLIIKLSTINILNDLWKLVIGFSAGVFTYTLICYLFNISEFRKTTQSLIPKIKKWLSK